ncbi:VPLPA-CTERM sorting domain-containing protein [Meridianimarinicoccus sp. RP-17]
MKQVVFTIAAAALASAVSVAAAQASTTISVETYSALDFAAKAGGLTSQTVEDFEGFGAGEVTSAFSTAVGTFSTLGGTGSGGTVSGTPGNTGTDLYLRDAGVFGRVNTTPGGSNFLDSNDTFGVEWVVDTGSMFDRILFTISDASDTGADLTILADGMSLTTFLDGQGNGTVDTVLISFGSKISTATLRFENRNTAGAFITNDGFGLDDMTVAAAVPLPPAVALLGAGVAALGALRRRGKAA